MADITLVDALSRLIEGSSSPGWITAYNLVLDALLQVTHKAVRTGVLQADTVPDYGIGAAGKNLGAQNANSLPTSTLAGGVYIVQAGSNFPVDQYGILVAKTYSVGSSGIAEYDWYPVAVGGKYSRRASGGSWADASWRTTWDSISDGNAGQPPAPKFKAYSAGLTVGECTEVDLVGVSTWTNPGGTWEYDNIVCTTATGVVTARYVSSTLGNIVNSDANSTYRLKLRRVL